MTTRETVYWVLVAVLWLLLTVVVLTYREDYGAQAPLAVLAYLGFTVAECAALAWRLDEITHTKEEK